MSYPGFAGYPCHPSQLSLMAGPNSTVSNAQCCPVSEGQTGHAVNSALNMNGDGPIIEPSVSPPPLSSVCTLTSPYESRLISNYSRLSGLYGSSYTDQSSFYASGTNPFYSSFGHPYDLKDANSSGWSALPQATCYPYETALYSPYGDKYGAMDSAARRKNATRETTNTLKAWLYEHRKNPYPTKGEKIMLAIITKMTLTQVSTWFANARRRLKKENKMTWEPRNKTGDGHDTDDKDSCKDSDDNSSSGITDNRCSIPENKELTVKKEPEYGIDKSDMNNDSISLQCKVNSNVSTFQTGDAEHNNHSHLHNGHNSKSLSSLPLHINNHSISSEGSDLENSNHIKHDTNQTERSELSPQVNSIDNLGQRPKIWSLAQTATSEGPPYTGKMTVSSGDWSATLPQGPDGLTSLSDYQRECPPLPPSGASTCNLRKGPATVWPEDRVSFGSSRSTTAAAAMQLFTSGPIGNANYLHSHGGKPATTGVPFSGTTHYHHHHPLSGSMSHLVHPNHHETAPFSSSYSVSANGLRPIIDAHSSHSSHNLTSEINENRISKGLSYSNTGHSNTKSANTFLCKVFPEYISSGPDALFLADNNSDRGGSTLSVEDSSDSSSPNLDSNSSNSIKNLNGSNSTTIGPSAFRPMHKR